MNDIVAPALLAEAATEQAPRLELRDVTQHFDVVSGHALRRFRVQPLRVEALARVSLAIAPGETVAVVGEQGAGKTTLARVASGALCPDAGVRRWRGRDAESLSGRERRAALLEVQVIGTDAWATLDPRCRVLRAIGEAPCAHGLIRRAQAIEYVGLQLNRVGIDPMRMRRFPGAFTRAEGVRLALARALAVRPKVLVVDDALRSLDPSARAQLLNLLIDLRAGGDLALLQLCSDMAEAAHLADRIVVLYEGSVVEQGPAAEVVAAPAHPYTRALLDAARVGGHAGRQTAVRGNPPSPAMRPSGCAFHPRCPQARRTCREYAPSLEDTGGARAVACHVAVAAQE